jgi:hypothetical protein
MIDGVSSATFSKSGVIREPVAGEPGYWAGAPGLFYAADESAWYLTYRLRRPRGIAPDRGGEARIARSTDLAQWEDVWSVTKGQFNSASIERCALRKGGDGEWRYFASYVDPADGRWCVSLLKGPDLGSLDPSKPRPLFKAHALGLEGIKDPWILESCGTFYMFLSVALPTPKTRDDSHATLDIFNTGECVSASGLAVSQDLDHWTWHGVIFTPAPGAWDAYCRRINSVVPYRGKFFAFYDGSASHLENYEEKTGLAVSSDLRHWTSLTPGRPLFVSRHSSGSLRYLDGFVRGAQICAMYEAARADGAHELRLTSAEFGSWLSEVQTSHEEA